MKATPRSKVWCNILWKHFILLIKSLKFLFIRGRYYNRDCKKKKKKKKIPRLHC
ncbi:hypothetical protein HanHA300_Chr12g0452111 [Helianthus annuus]|nr:hypothetical protein HanHA300_Chr12g0452111 [Helianthus annuus]KAJ0506058.1 hypothetical protein HanHA89_Chr12g0477621 [Helianthus annuus]KAJ0675728.1 hypothetical protein HanLR1_Chr12g0454511 [Helianthus annuus]